MNRAGYTDAVIRKIDHPDPEKLWALVLTQVGKKYRWTRISDWVLRIKRFHDGAKWGCDELFGWAYLETGGHIIHGDHIWHLSPNDWFMVSKELPG